MVKKKQSYFNSRLKIYNSRFGHLNYKRSAIHLRVSLHGEQLVIVSNLDFSLLVILASTSIVRCFSTVRLQTPTDNV